MLLLDSNVITPILLSDSKRLYLEKHILPGMDQRIKLVYNVPFKFCCENSRSTTKAIFHSIHVYVWLGTYDLTSYNKGYYNNGYISLHTDQTTQNFNEIVTIFNEYPVCKLTFIETPSYSIYE